MNSQCDLCASTENLKSFKLEANNASITVCTICDDALTSNDFSNTHHWRGLQEAIWSEATPVKIVSYRILHSLRSEPWAQDLLEQIYLEDEDLNWAKKGLKEESSSGGANKITKDSNGTELLEGDSVTLIKDLDVKGAGFTAKRGTLVKNIRLTENPEQIEGRVNSIQIVLLTKFLKKV